MRSVDTKQSVSVLARGFGKLLLVVVALDVVWNAAHGNPSLVSPIADALFLCGLLGPLLVGGTLLLLTSDWQDRQTMRVLAVAPVTTPSRWRRLRHSIAAIGAFVVGALCARWVVHTAVRLSPVAVSEAYDQNWKAFHDSMPESSEDPAPL